VSAADDEDFVAYVTGRLPVLRRVATQLAGDAHRGDDLVQQAITRLFVHWRRGPRTENLDAYVYKILTRVFLDERRLRWASVKLGAAPADLEPVAGSVNPVTEVDDRMLLREALATLPPRQRAILVLRFLVDRPVDEVADILRIAPGTVKSQTHDGLAALRRLLGNGDTAATNSGVNP
jgi:RNA polymerase sigma-70 factor (sigma-E family)